ncbi:MAG: hypothetical protein ACYTG0_09720, partial [Planctomycetota bacterium]
GRRRCASRCRQPLGRFLTGGPTVWMKPLLCVVFLAGAIYDAGSTAGRQKPGRSPRVRDPAGGVPEASCGVTTGELATCTSSAKTAPLEPADGWTPS